MGLIRIILSVLQRCIRHKLLLVITFIAVLVFVANAQKEVIDKGIDSTARIMKRSHGRQLLNAKLSHAGYMSYYDTAFARRTYQAVLQESIERNYVKETILAYRGLLIHYFGQRQPDLAFDYGRRLLNLAEKESLLETAGENALLIAKYNLQLNRFDSAIHYLNKAENFYRLSENATGLAEVIDRKGLWYSLQGQHDTSLKIYHHAMNILGEQGSKKIRGVINYHIGIEHFFLGNYELAAIYINRAIEAWEPFGPDVGIAQKWNSLEMLGNIYLKLKNYRQGLQFHQRALEVRKIAWEGLLKEEFNLSYAYSYNNFAEAYYGLGIIDSALFYGEKSLKIKLRPQTNAHSTDIANSYLMMAKILRGQNESKKSMLYADSAIFYYKDAANKGGLAEAYLNKAQLLTGINLMDALQMVNLAHDLATETGSKHILRDVYREKSLILEKAGDLSSALKALNEYVLLNNEILNAEIVSRVAEQYEKYESEKKSLQIHHLNIDNERKKRLNAIMTWAFVLSLVLAILLTVFVYILRINARNKAKALKALAEVSSLKEEKYRNEMEMKNMELKRLLDAIKNKNIILDTIKSVMLEEIKNNCKAPVEVFNRTVKTIQSHVVTDQDWEIVNRQIEEVESVFEQKLKTLHPDLTQHDIRMAVYIKLNLSTREIASLLNITQESVRKQKFRLKKKLSIGEQALDEYLIGL